MPQPTLRSSGARLSAPQAAHPRLVDRHPRLPHHVRGVLLRAALRGDRHLVQDDGPDRARRDLLAAHHLDARGLVEGLGRGLLRHDLRRASGSASSTRSPSCSRAWSCRSRCPRSPAMRWRCGTCAGPDTFLFVLFMCAFVPFQIIMIPLIVLTAPISDLRHDLGDRHRPCRAGDAAADADLPQLLQGHSAGDHERRDHGFRLLLAIFVEIILPMSGNILIVVLILQITSSGTTS